MGTHGHQYILLIDGYENHKQPLNPTSHHLEVLVNLAAQMGIHTF